MLLLTNEMELKQVYNWDSMPIDNLDHANNLAYKLGLSSWNNNLFDPYLEKLVNAGTLEKVYDFIQDGTREGLYTFKDNKAQLSFFGSNHMDIRLFFNY